MKPAIVAIIASVLAAPSLMGSNGSRAEPAKALAPIPAATLVLMAAKGTTAAAPLVIRTFKKEAELEIWKRDRTGRFVYIKTFPICRWSGQLGPKTMPGDRQTPEGFYAVTARQMNPNSHYYLSFDTGFPNDYDKARGASGAAVMVHGTCSSMGCFAMTDKQIGEIYAIARDALKGGQAAFQLQSYPFHMSAKNMALYRNDRNIAFWRQLKEGSDRFEATGEILRPGVAEGRYTFAASPEPAREKAFARFHAAETAKIAAMVKDGSAAVTTAYADGGQHAIFAALLRRGTDLGVVSRPEALAYAAIDVTLIPARPPQRLLHQPIVVTFSDWRPDPAPSTAKIVKARISAVPASIGSALAAVPISYAMVKASGEANLIRGAMPARSASKFD